MKIGASLSFWITYIVVAYLFAELISWTDVAYAVGVLFWCTTFGVLAGFAVRRIGHQHFLWLILLALILYALCWTATPSRVTTSIPSAMRPAMLLTMRAAMPDFVLGVVVGAATRVVEYKLLLGLAAAMLPTIGTYVVFILSW